MTDTTEEINMQLIRDRVSDGDADAQALLKSIEAEEAIKRKLANKIEADEHASAQLSREREKSAKSRKVKSGVVLVIHAAVNIFEDCLSSVVNYIEDHGGDIQSLRSDVNGSSYIALVHYTVDISIAHTMLDKLREVQSERKRTYRNKPRTE